MKYTPESYARWLQAEKPPLEWFLEQSETDQGTMAEQGAIYRVDGYIEQAQAIQDPALFEAQIYAESDPEAAEYLVRRLADSHAAQLGEDAPQRAPITGVRSMGQALEDCQEDVQERIATDGKARPFLGRMPDSVVEAAEA